MVYNHIDMRYEEIKFKSLGTNNSIRINHEKPEEILYKCRDLVYYYHKLICDFYKDMNLKAKDKEYGFSLDVYNEIFYMIEKGLKFSKLKDSKLNIFIGALISLWDISPKKVSLPDDILIKRNLRSCNPKSVRLDKNNRRIYFSNSKTRVDLGALAKGYIADRLLDFLKNMKVFSALIDLGGDIYCHGFNLDRSDLYWHIGIQRPFSKSGEEILKLKLNDMALVSSGIYERFFRFDNKIYHHILDPKTGYPIETDMLSLSILSKKSFEAEIWSSVLFGSDFEKIKNLSQKHDFGAIAIYENDLIKYNKNLSKFIIGV